MQRSITLTTEPIWEDIEKIRTESNVFLITHGLSPETVDAVTMIVSELVENSIKYGCFQKSDNKVEINISIADDDIIVEVINPFDDSVQSHLKRLDKAIQWIRGYQDPFEAYIERMKEISRRPINDPESGLGLVRIAYEGGAILDFYVTEQGLLNVSTISKFYTRTAGDCHE